MYSGYKKVLAAIIPGQPVPFARPRKGKHRNKAGKPTFFNTPRMEEFQERAIPALKLGCNADAHVFPIQGPIALQCYFYMRRPSKAKLDKFSFVPMIRRPDLDNLVKNIMDALQKSEVLGDDAIVFKLDCAKLYCCAGMEPQTDVALYIQE